MPVMSVVHAFPIRLLGTATLAAALVLAAGPAGVLPPLIAVGTAVAVAAGLPAVALLRLALAIHRATGAWTVCRGAGLLSLGVVAGGISTAALSLLGPGQRPVLALTGLAVATAAYLLGMLLLPGVATTATARLRRAFDGLSIGVSLWFTAWLLLPRRPGHSLAYAAVFILVVGLAVIAVIVLRTTRRRATVLRCGGGAGSALAGLAGLVVLMEYHASAGPLAVAALPVLAGPLLIWAGARRSEVAPRPPLPAHRDGTFAAYPMLALPVGVGLLAAAYHILVLGPLDRSEVLLGIGMGAALAVREVLAAADVRRFARRIAGQEARLRALVTGASDVAMVLGDDLVVRWQSPAAARQFGLYDPDVLGHPFVDLVHPDDGVAVADWLRMARAGGGRNRAPGRQQPLIEARVMDGYGRWRETESSISDLRGIPEVGALVVHVRDVGGRRHLERTLHRLASTDHLTGLPNRREVLRAVAARQGSGHRSGALLVCDLPGLAGVADPPGRAAYEAVLVEAALRVRVHAGPEDLIGRLGETQLAVVTAEGPIEAYGLGVRLLAALTSPYQLPDRRPVQVQASVGMAGLAAGPSADDVLRRSMLALRQAGQLGRNRIEWYDESLEEQLVRRLDLERHLPGAAGRDELALVYQPVAELDTQRPVGVEALVRWRHPFLGTVLPGELLPIADKLRVGEEIRDWVLHTACRQAAAWRREGYDLWLAVNVSARQLTAGFVPEVAAALSVHQIPPERLTVELAAAQVGCDVPTIATQLSKLRALGVRTALDDFGTGDTDLAQLRRLPLDVVKLAPPSTSGGTGGLAAAVVDVARRLGLSVVAEGLETADQLAVVRDAGCRYGQGFQIARPAPAEHIAAYLAELAAPATPTG